MLRFIQRAGQLAGSVAGFFATVTIIVLFLLLIMQVLFRYVLQVSAPWVEELARIAYISMVLFGSSLCISHNEHIKVDFFIDRLSPRSRAVSRIIICLVMGYFLYGVFRGSLRMIALQRNIYLPGIRFLKISHAYSIMPVSIVLMWISLLGEIAANSIQFLEGPLQMTLEDGSE